MLPEEITEDVKTAAYQIIDRKGYTNYAVALAITRITQAILRDENSILTISSLLDGAYGIEGVYTSVPTVVGRSGSKQNVEVPYSSNEIEALRESATLLKDILKNSDL